MTAGYIEIEKALSEAKSKFAAAFDGVDNARIVKTQYNKFALRFKYAILMLLSLACIITVIVFQIVWQQFDPLYIVCECIIFLFLTSFIVLLAISWRLNLRNAKCAEVIEYYNGKKKCMYSLVAGGGSKIEWQEARFYFSPKGEVELFEGGEKIYSPFLYKKIRGHSRNFVLLSSEAILTNFFDGAEVVSDENGTVELSSGFRFHIEEGALKWLEIDGMFSECYENNFPLYAVLSSSSSYTFRYEFEEINRKNYTLILPQDVREACKYYFIKPPQDENILIEDLKK